MQRGAEDPLATTVGAHSLRPASACCCWPKARAPDQPARLPGAPAAEPAWRLTCWPSSRPATKRLASRLRRWPAACLGRRAASPSVTETELFAAGLPRGDAGAGAGQRRRRALISDPSELNVGDPVVHSQHGIGATAARSTWTWREAPPPSCSTSTPAAPRARAMPSASAAHDYEAFADDFGFEETPDQHAAIHAVIQDMISLQPMDRLVCGDVGFGKTEVAARRLRRRHRRQQVAAGADHAAGRAALPDLRRPLRPWPVKVAEMSRFARGKEVKAAMEGWPTAPSTSCRHPQAAQPEKTQFKNLGLLIIDEEHRFGAPQGGR